MIPDLPNHQGYPIPLSRMRRKITRDLTGQVGYRRIKSIWHAIINLPRLDLLGKGIYENTHFTRGYINLLREVTNAGVS